MSKLPYLILLLLLLYLTLLLHIKSSTYEPFITWFTPFLPDESAILPIRLKHLITHRSHSHGTLTKQFADQRPLQISYPGPELQSFVKDLSIFVLSKTRTLNLTPILSTEPVGDFAIYPAMQMDQINTSYCFVTTCYPRFLYIFGYKRRVETMWDIRDRRVSLESHPMTYQMFSAMKTDMENIIGETIAYTSVQDQSFDDLVAGKIDVLIYTDTYPGKKYYNWFKNHTSEAASVILLDVPQELRQNRDIRSTMQLQAVDLNRFVNGYLPKQVDKTYYHQYRPTLYLWRSCYVLMAKADTVPAKTVDDFLTQITPEFLIGAENQIDLSMRDMLFNGTALFNHPGTDAYMTRMGYQTENPSEMCMFVIGTGLTCDPTLIRKIQDETF